MARTAAPAVRTVTGAAIPHATPVLTRSEAVIAGLAATGLTSAQIGNRLGVRARTVEKHLEHAHLKLGVTNRVDLIAAFRELLQATL